jgi:DNA-binding transcriptional MerR regulator/ubiquinone/menaquinone biosynthesis C-methylase UbiE
MHKEGYYSSGEFAKKANVTVRTIRYYDKQNILKPSYVTDTGVRFYTDSDFTRLQQILLLKYLGFSLDDIKGMTIGDSDYNILKNSLHLQLKLIQDKMAQMQLVKNAIEDTIKTIDKDNTIDWSSMLSLIHLTNMESSLKTQYQNAGNISARINLHAMYSVNRQGWFKWIYEQGNIASHTEVLELGCGDGRLWVDNIDSVISQNIKPHITVSDISEGMVNDARRNITEAYEKCVKNHKNMVSSNNIFEYDVADCQNMSYNDASYDCVIANHVLFYCEDIDKACQEIVRVLKPGGVFVCATYGSRHMQEISQLVKEFDKRIVLAADNLYDKFGLDTGDKQLNKYFTSVNIRRYDDCLKVDKAEPLVEYILSCHGNQNQYLLDRYSDFKSFIQKKLRKTLTITKDAGLFYCVKE